MKNKYLLLLMSILVISNLFSQYWKATGALSAIGKSFYLVAATSVGNNIFAAHANKNLGYSTDLGKTWITDGINEPKGDFALLTGIKDRLYASMKISPSDYELLYSTNNGQSWTMDTIGLPRTSTVNGITAMILVDMGNNYILAHNYLKTFYKHKNDNKWTPTEIGSAVVDVSAINDKWLIIVGGKIIQSTNHGLSWSTIITTGLPDKFQGYKITTNGSRLYMISSTAAHANNIYYSDDEGVTWMSSSIAGLYTYANAYPQNLYAVNDYVFSAVMPKQFDFNTPPPFLVSSEKILNFTVGDVSGFPSGSTISNLAFFFHIQNKLYTMFGDLYVSEPGFTGSPSAVQNLNENESSILVQPNPADKVLQFIAKDLETYKLEIFSIQGKLIYKQSVESKAKIDISAWSKGVYLVKSTNQDGVAEQTKFIKK